VIDGNDTKSPLQCAQAIAHEVRHAQYEYKEDRSSKTNFVYRALSRLPTQNALCASPKCRTCVDTYASLGLPQNAQFDGLENGLVFVHAAQFVHGIVHVKHGGAFADAQNVAHLPGSFGFHGPTQGFEFARG
jgi:hypothetical protein